MLGERPEIIKLYRMIHVDNLEYILKHGMHIQNSQENDPNYINIGDSVLIDQRHEYPIGIDGCGHLGDYIPFYFAGHSPMLLNIKTGYRGIQKRSQCEIVYIVCKLGEIVDCCPDWIFADGHAKDRFTVFYKDLDQLDQIDWDVVKAQYWHNIENDYDRQRRKQAEFLVKNHVPPSCIDEIVVRNEVVKKRVEIIVQRLNLTLSIYTDTQDEFFYHD